MVVWKTTLVQKLPKRIEDAVGFSLKGLQIHGLDGNGRRAHEPQRISDEDEMTAEAATEEAT